MRLSAGFPNTNTPPNARIRCAGGGEARVRFEPKAVGRARARHGPADWPAPGRGSPPARRRRRRSRPEAVNATPRQPPAMRTLPQVLSDAEQSRYDGRGGALKRAGGPCATVALLD